MNIRANDPEDLDPRELRGLSLDWNKILLIMAVVSAIGGPAATWGAVQARITEQEKRYPPEERAMLYKHEALLPTVQQDIRDLKSLQQESANDIKSILRVVKG